MPGKTSISEETEEDQAAGIGSQRHAGSEGGSKNRTCSILFRSGASDAWVAGGCFGSCEGSITPAFKKSGGTKGFQSTPEHHDKLRAESRCRGGDVK